LAASPARLGLAEYAAGFGADVDRRGDRGDHLVATQDAPGARGAVATGRDAALHHRTATAAGEDVAEDADGVAADVDRRGDRGDHLVATQGAPGARGAVAAGRDARLVLDRGDDHLAAAARRVPPVGVMPLGGRDVALVPLPRGGLALAPPLAVAAGEPPAALAVAVVDRPALALADLGAALAA